MQLNISFKVKISIVGLHWKALQSWIQVRPVRPSCNYYVSVKNLMDALDEMTKEKVLQRIPIPANVGNLYSFGSEPENNQMIFNGTLL